MIEVPITKLPACCARPRARVTMEEANLARLAHKTAIRAGKGLSIVQLQQRIAECKVQLAQAKAAVDDHDANHAGGGL
jgi:hypothetical protein